MPMGLVLTVLACGDACHQDAGWGRSRAKAKTSARKRAPSRSTTRSRPASQAPRALAKGRAAAPGSSPATAPTPPPSDSVVVGVLCALGLWTDLAGPVGSTLADGTGRCSAAPGWRSRSRASPSPCCCCGPGARPGGADLECAEARRHARTAVGADRDRRGAALGRRRRHPAPRLRPARARRLPRRLAQRGGSVRRHHHCAGDRRRRAKSAPA